jgi:hypothetical protein
MRNDFAAKREHRTKDEKTKELLAKLANTTR